MRDERRDDSEALLWWCVECGQPGRLDRNCPACGARAYSSTPPRREIRR